MKNRLFGYEKQTRFSFRKMSIGLISCGIGAFWIMGGTVMADEVTENTAESNIETVSTRTISEETTPVEVVKKSTVSIEKMSEQRELEISAKQMIDLSEPHLKSKDVLEVDNTSVIPTVTTSASTEATRSITDEEVKTSEARLEETGVTNLRHVTIPEGVTEIGSSAFSDNPQLTKITLPSSLKKIGSNAFYGTNLTSIDLPEGLEEIGSEAFSGTKLTELVLPSSLKRIDSYAFRNISTLTKVHIPAHLESASNVFAYNYEDGTASPITEVSFESGIESIPSGLFNGVSSLTNVTIPSTVKRIGASAFSRTNLAEISIPEGVEYIGSSAFGNIERLKKVTLPSSVTDAYNTFSGSRNLTDVKLGAGFTKLPDSFLSGTGITEFVVPEGVTEIGSSAFSDNPQLTKITLPSSLKKIGSNAFNGTGLTSLAIPEGVTDIGSYAFSSTPLERIILPTGLKIIGSGAFRNTKLIEIEIPEGVEYLDDYTLADNPQLKKVYLPKSITALVNRWGEQLPDAEFHVYLDSFALEYMIEHQLNFKLRDENVANDESKILDSQSSYYLPTTSSSRRQGYLGLDLKYSLKDGKSSDDGTYNLKLNIPASTTIFDGKVRYNGTDIPVSVQEGYITIPVTEKEGKIKLMLTSGNKELTNLRLFAQLAYQKDGQKVAEVIGATNVTVPVLTLTANKATSRSYSRISGIADPADRVTAYLDEQSVGLIKVKKDGTYTLDIPLANPVNNKEYKIKVVALSPDGQELSEVTTVRYEEKLPELENFIMRHNGYAYNMKEHKDKVPVINFRPGGKFEFEAEYTNTEQIENVYLVSTREGIKKYVQLYYDENLKKYIYHGYFDEKNTSYVPGKLELQIINKEKRIPSILVELEGKKIDYLSSEFKEKYKIIDELNRDKFVTRIINRETQKVVLTEEISIDILKELFDNIQNNSESQPKKSSILVKEKENNLGFRSAEGTKGEPILKLFYALLLEEAGIINLNQFLNPGKFALDELYKIPELIFRKYAGLSKDLTTVSDNVFDGIKDKLLENKAVKDEIAKVPGLDKVVNNIGLFQELGNFVLKWSMLELLEQLLENPKLVIQGNYKYNALQTIKREKNNFITSSIMSLGVSAASNAALHVRLGALIYDFGATFYNFTRGLGGKLEKWERIPTVSGLPESFYENIIDDLKIGAPTLTDLKVKTKLETKTSFTKKMEEPDTDSDGLYSLKYTTTNTNSSGFTTSSIPTFQFIIDPSGVVINDISNNPVTGATTTLYYKGENGEEVLWDAGEYSQLNPLSTTVNGEYAWDVPEGQWKVKVSKDGYESAESDWLPVPPPQTEVHFKLKPLSYTLSYQVGDGSLGKNAASTYQTDVDTALPYPVRKGYTFAGWYDNAAFIGRPYFNTLFETAGDKELFAKWEKASDVLSDDESTLSITVNGIDTTRVSSISRKSVESDELLKKLPLQVSANDVSFTKIQLLDSENKSISLTEEAEVEMATIGGRKPIKLLHYLADEDKFKEVPFKWIESNHSLAFSMTNSSVYAMVYQLSDTKQEVKVHKESRILTTNEVTYLDDPSLDTGRTREIPAVAGQVVVEITEIYVNGDLQSSTEKELSRTPAQAKKVYRGTKLVTDIPNVAPIEEEKPEAKLETKVRQVIRVLTTDEVVYLDDPSLDTGRTREIPAVAGQVVVEITEIYVNGDLQSSAEKELSRTPAQAKKVYRGTRSVSSVPSVAPTTPELSEEKLEMKTRLVVNSFPDVTYAGQRHSQIVYKNRKEESTLPETGEKIYSVSVLTGLSLMLAGLYTLKKKEY